MISHTMHADESQQKAETTCAVYDLEGKFDLMMLGVDFGKEEVDGIR